LSICVGLLCACLLALYFVFHSDDAFGQDLPFGAAAKALSWGAADSEKFINLTHLDSVSFIRHWEVLMKSDLELSTRYGKSGISALLWLSAKGDYDPSGLKRVLTNKTDAFESVVGLFDRESDGAPSVEFQSWDDFLLENPQWSLKGAYTLFKDAFVQLFQRLQLIGNCFMQAGVVSLSYATNSSMLDMTAYILAHFKAVDIRLVIVEGLGGDSATFLATIAGGWDHIKPVDIDSAERLLRQGEGPILVSRFHVDEAFGNQSLSVHTGNVSVCNSSDTHAMVLIGTRRTESGEVRFLLQNWWRSKQFVEVSFSYLDSSNAVLWRLVAPVTTSHSLGSLTAAESVIDGMDGWAPEAAVGGLSAV
jgi:hypothetical protein